MSYTEFEVTSALNKLKRKIPYGWDLNIYRGCLHNCKYCYAMYSHKYLDDNNYFNNIYIKKNIIDVLEKELSSPDWKREIVNIGGVTDSYQPIEKDKKLMREVLRLMIKYKTPVIISSKSDLILRDYDLIDELSHITLVNIAQTITSTDEKLRVKLEPHTSPYSDRFNVLKEFRKTNASIGLHIMPIIPYLTDSYKNLNSLLSMAKEVNVDYYLPGTLYLRGETKPYFLNFIKDNYPEHYDSFIKLYQKGSLPSEYKEKLYKTVNELKAKYNLSSSYSKPLKDRLK